MKVVEKPVEAMAATATCGRGRSEKSRTWKMEGDCYCCYASIQSSVSSNEIAGNWPESSKDVCAGRGLGYSKKVRFGWMRLNLLKCYCLFICQTLEPPRFANDAANKPYFKVVIIHNARLGENKILGICAKERPHGFFSVVFDSASSVEASGALVRKGMRAIK